MLPEKLVDVNFLLPVVHNALHVSDAHYADHNAGNVAKSVGASWNGVRDAAKCVGKKLVALRDEDAAEVRKLSRHLSKHLLEQILLLAFLHFFLPA